MGVGVVALFASGCKTGTDAGAASSGAGGSSASNGGKRFKVGISIPAADHGWTAGVKYWADQASKQNPDIDWTIKDAKEPNEQISDLENFQTQGVDAIVILATESAPLTPIAEKLHNAGILIVNVDRGFTKPVADVYIAGDNKAFGRKSAEFIVQKLDGKGKIAVLEGIPSTVNSDRVEAAKAVFAQTPNIQIVAEDSGMWNREKAEKVMQNMLVAHPDIDAIWASDDDMALGAESALKEAGKDKKVWILGGAGMKDIIQRVMNKDPMYPADITYPPSMIAFGIQTAAGMLRAGKDNAKQYTPKHITLDVDLVTPDNAKDFYFPDSKY
jgi:ribose transport system substrate-binding protein